MCEYRYNAIVYRSAYTIFEFLVAIFIVTFLATTLGAFLTQLLTIQEKEREEAYIRERLVDICATYADYLSVGTVISNTTSGSFIATYRRETGGISLETGRVDHVSQMLSSYNEYETSNGKRYSTIDMGFYSDELGERIRKFPREFRGDELPLIAAKDLRIKDSIVSLTCRITPLNESQMEDAALGYLTVTAWYNMKGAAIPTNATAGRIVRLWNRE